MPNPTPGEDRDDFLDRCIPEVVREGYEPDQAVAMCISYFEGEKDKAFDIPADNRIEYWKAFDRRRQSFEAKYTRRIYRAIKEMLGKLEDATNANELQKPLNTSILKQTYTELYNEVGNTFAASSYNGLKSAFIDNTKQADRWAQRDIISNHLNSQINDRIKGIDQATRNEINRIIMRGLEQGMSIDEIRDRIIGVTGLAPLNGTLTDRSRRIARTEIIAASNYGSLEGAISTGLNFRKQWLSTPDARTRRKPLDQFDHHEMNGTTVGMNEKFIMRSKKGAIDELEYPGDPSGMAGNVINCRCVLIYDTGEDDQSASPVTMDDFSKKAGDELAYHKGASWNNDEELLRLVNLMADVDVYHKGDQAFYSNKMREDVAQINMNGYDPENVLSSPFWRHEYGHHIDFQIELAANTSRPGSALRKKVEGKPSLSRYALNEMDEDYRELLKRKKEYDKYRVDVFEEDEYFNRQVDDLLSSPDISRRFDELFDNGTFTGDDFARLSGLKRSELDSYLRDIATKTPDSFKRSALTRILKQVNGVNRSVKTGYPLGMSSVKDDYFYNGIDESGNLMKLLPEEAEKRIKLAKKNHLLFMDYVAAASGNKVYDLPGHSNKYYSDRGTISINSARGLKLRDSHAMEVFANHVALRGADTADIYERLLMTFYPRTQSKMRNIITASIDNDYQSLLTNVVLSNQGVSAFDDAEDKLIDFIELLESMSGGSVNNTAIQNFTMNRRLPTMSPLNDILPSRGYIDFRKRRDYITRIIALSKYSDQGDKLDNYIDLFLTSPKYNRLMKYLDKAIQDQRELTEDELEDVFGADVADAVR